MFRGLFHSIREAFFQLFYNKLMSCISILAISSMLVILGIFLMLTVNISCLTEKVKDEFDTIEVYLEDSVTKSDAQVIARNIGSMAEVANIEYISRDQAMIEFRQRWGENAYLLDSLSENPLPNSLRITLNGLEGGDLVAEVASTTIGVEDVKYYQEEINKVLKISATIKKISFAIISILVAVSIVVVSSTIRFTVVMRKEEINIFKYIGATNWFVRGPFLFEGMIMGFLSAILALRIVMVIYERIELFLNIQIMSILSSSFVDVVFMKENLSWIFLSLGISIGAVGSMFSMRKFLKV